MALLKTGWSCGISLSFDDLWPNILDRHPNGVIYATFLGMLPFKCAINQASHRRNALACEFNLLLILRQSPLCVRARARAFTRNSKVNCAAGERTQIAFHARKGSQGLALCLCMFAALLAKNSSGSWELIFMEKSLAIIRRVALHQK